MLYLTSDAEIKEGIFVGQQIRELFSIKTLFGGSEKETYEKAFKSVVNFLGNRRTQNYSVALHELLST